MSFFFGRGGKGIPKNATFRITQEGTAKLQEFVGDAKSQILTALETRGSCNAREISETSGLSTGKVERNIPSLMQGGYIQYISPSMASAEE